MGFRHIVAAMGVVALAGTMAAAQQPPAEGRGGERGGAPVPEPHNLQVLPKTMTLQQVLPIMRNVSGALGVNCGYCHEWTAPGAPTNDFAADTKPTKATARVMMHMTNDINMKLASEIKKPADQITRVGCATCHRGSAIPKVDTPAPAAPRGAGPGAPPAGAPAGAPPAGAPPPPGR